MGFTRLGKQKGKPKKEKCAVSRIMIASAKMRYFKIRGGGEEGEEDEDLDEVKIANAHLHCRTAKRELEAGGSAYKRCLGFAGAIHG